MMPVTLFALTYYINIKKTYWAWIEVYMKFGIKKSKGYVYGFNADEELSIYSKIGEKKSTYQNYCEWHSYICEKYGGSKYSESTLKNFMHYLKREKNIIKSTKEIWSSSTIPLLTVFITIIYTFIFSLVNVINTYNNSISSLINDEFFECTGYDSEVIYNTLEQNLYSGMGFYAFGTVIMILAVLMFLSLVSDKIRSNNLKNEFYADYIVIIQEIVEEQKVGNTKTV